MREREAREAICEIGRRLYQRGLVAAWDGNISARLDDGGVLCTPTLFCKGHLRPDDLCIVDSTGNQLSGPHPRTSEIRLHLVIYRERADVHAVVHTHAPHASAFAITGTPIPNGILAEVEVFLGVVPLVEYLTPGTAAFAESVVPYLDRTNTLVLGNHGTVAYGPTLERAWGLTEILDAYCRILILARGLGPVRTFSERQIGELLEIKQRLGLSDPRN
jgi:L-fuculose-phosphate aldolase